MEMKKWIASIGIGLLLATAVFLLPGAPVLAMPQLQMTPGTDPMSAPTAEAPTPQPGDALTDPYASAAAMNCPMMGGSMTGMAAMPGMAGMPGMSGMPGMNGMNSMGGMTGMNGMNGMAQMGNMPMVGMRGMNDGLSLYSRPGGLVSQNPWWLLGWLMLFSLAVALVVIFGAGVIWMARRLRKDKVAPVEN
jgi:hypothetical protein